MEIFFLKNHSNYQKPVKVTTEGGEPEQTLGELKKVNRKPKRV